jgi:V/A-type H+/Na+-transporting ATPase subunit K
MLLLALLISTTVVLATITLGVHVYKNGHIQGINSFKTYLGGNLALFIPAAIFSLMVMVPEVASAAGETGLATGAGLALLGAGLSTGLASIGAGVAVGNVGSAAIGAVSEDPKMLGKSLIFVGLGEGIAIYGILMSILIFGRM